MKYPNIHEGIFINRPNRFIAHVKINETIVPVHVKNTGRCAELLIPGAKVFVQGHDNPNRKTKFSLIAVIKGNRLINMDSQAPNKIWEEALKKNIQIPEIHSDFTLIKPEYRYGKSRLDFYVETRTNNILMEVKGVTLENNGIAMFPDAPTQRGIKHIHELIKATECGYLAYIIFIIQMNDIDFFTPNHETHGDFAIALLKAQKAGVHILAYDCKVQKDEIRINKEIPIQL